MNKTQYVIFENDERGGIVASLWESEYVHRFFKDKDPELYHVAEWTEGERGPSLNGQVWLEENPCPCCGHRRERPLTGDQEWALDQVRPGPRY